MRTTTLCPKCEKAKEIEREAAAAEQARRERERKFFKACPREYWASDPELLPDRDSFETVCAWSGGPKGLVLMGPTGSGKTRATWELGRNLIINHGINFVFLTEIDLKSLVLSGKLNGDYRTQMSRYLAAAVLGLDDLGKAKMTDGLEEAEYELLEGRTSRGLPSIITTQLNGDEIAGRYSPDCGAAILRRLREHFETVVFRPQARLREHGRV